VIEPRRWTVDITPVARRELLALRGAIQDRLRAAIRALGDDPIPPDSIVMPRELGFAACASGITESFIGSNPSA